MFVFLSLDLCGDVGGTSSISASDVPTAIIIVAAKQMFTFCSWILYSNSLVAVECFVYAWLYFWSWNDSHNLSKQKYRFFQFRLRTIMISPRIIHCISFGNQCDFCMNEGIHTANMRIFVMKYHPSHRIVKMDHLFKHRDEFLYTSTSKQVSVPDKRQIWQNCCQLQKPRSGYLHTQIGEATNALPPIPVVVLPG